MRILGVLGLGAALFLFSCSSNSLPVAQDDSDLTAELAGMPSPLEAGRQVSSEPAYALGGAEFQLEGLAPAYVAADGAAASFTPAWDPTGEPASYELAYALYAFELTDFSQGRWLASAWTTPPPAGTLLIGLGNWETDRWDWYPATANPADEERLRIEDLAPYMDETERLLAVVALSANGEYLLDELRLEGQPPVIIEVDQDGFDPGSTATFALTLAGGSGELSYLWNFGAGAEPQTSTDPAPTVTLAAPGTYNAEVRVENELGFGELEFVMVSGTPTIGDVRPREGVSGAETQFEADVSGSEPLTYAWDFGGGAIPNTSDEASPSVALGFPGDYDCNLTVSNEYGEADIPFALHVVPFIPHGLYIMPDPEDEDWFGVLGSGTSEDPFIVSSDEFNADYQVVFSLAANSQPDGTGYIIDVTTLSWDAYPPFIVEDPSWATPGEFRANQDGFTNGYIFAEDSESNTSNDLYILSVDVMP
jgi:hypothetical protein